MIRIIEHNDTGETRVLGEDHLPFSFNRGTAPEEVAEAVKQGFGLNVPDLDVRDVDWIKYV